MANKIKTNAPLMHCDASMMHSKAWNGMRSRTAGVSGRGSGNKQALAKAKQKRLSPFGMSPLYGKISSACKSAAKRKFKVWPSAYASGWGVRCTKAGGPSKFGGGKK